MSGWLALAVKIRQNVFRFKLESLLGWAARTAKNWGSQARPRFAARSHSFAGTSCVRFR